MVRIAGVDEVGRGPLAGPVVAAAVVFKDSFSDPRIKDSKKLSQKMREYLSEEIKSIALDWSIVSLDNAIVDKFNILEASKIAMGIAVSMVSCDEVLVDGNARIYTGIPQTCIIGGDRIKVQISAASIIAKVWRDALMKDLGALHPVYGFENHAGYPTKFHKEQIKAFGPSPLHRKSFRGVKEVLQEEVLLSPYSTL